MEIKDLIKYKIRSGLFKLSGFFLGLIPKKKGLILFTSWFGNKYIDNSKYLYEYLLNYKEYTPIWMTRNLKIYKQLLADNKPVSLFSSIRGVILQIRAEAVVSSVQFTDFNTWLLTKCIYLDLGHGHPIKDPGAVIHDEYQSKVYSDIQKRVHYYSIVAGEKTRRNYCVVKVPQDRIYISDFARNDVFEDEQLRKAKNSYVSDFKNGRKAIVYMPTHRSDGQVRMNMNEILPLSDIQKF